MNFKLWHDPWLINQPLIEKFGSGFISVMDSSSFATVGSIYLDNRWSVAMANDLSAIHFRQLLATSTVAEHDSVLWNGDSDVTLRIIYDSIRTRGTPKAWQILLWHKFHIPACSFISWLACRDRLLTKDRMILFHMNVDSRCLFCHCTNENVVHLFTQCPYSYLLLRDCPYNLIIDWSSWQQGVFFHDQLTSVKKSIGFLYITVVIYLVWLERNARNHGKGVMSFNQMSAKVKRMVREKLFTCAAFQREVRRDPTFSQILY